MPEPRDSRDRSERCQRTRSPSYDSEEERARRRRRRERESRSSPSRRDGEKTSRRRERDSDGRDRERDSKLRRSLSPRDRKDRDRERDPVQRRRDSRERSSRAPREEKAVSRKAAGPLPSQEAAFTGEVGVVAGEKAVEKQLPNFQPTGVLAAASNTVAQADGTSIVLKYHEPAEARKPPAKDEWKLFVFKGKDIVETIELSARSCWLVGKERAVVDLPAEHPSISRQHAVIQFRYIEKRNEFGDKVGRVRPYLIDLESGNGTLWNGVKVEPARYLELRDKDMLQFGHSTREYVLMLPPK